MTDRQTPPIYGAQDARQGEIILRTRTRRIIFLSGIIGAIVLGFLSIVLAQSGHHIFG